MSAPPPPPPPHGEVPRSSGLPPGKYDIFVIPQHSAGAGFLYLPSLRPNVNSFAAGFASALITVALFQSMAPAFQAWWDGFQGLGNMGITLLVLGVGFGAWALGRIQNDPARGPPRAEASARRRPRKPAAAAARLGSALRGSPGGAPPGGAPLAEHPGGAPPGSAPPPPQHEKPKTWQRSPPQTKGSWEKAREETRRKEDERKAKEAEQKRRDEAARRLAELRAREAKERQEREEKEAKEREEREKQAAQEREEREKQAAKEREEREKQEAREREEREKQEARQREAREREEREKQAAKEREEREKREAREREAREREQREKAQGGSVRAAESSPRAGRSYAFSSVGEKTNMWPNGRPTVSPQRPPAPTARTCVDDDAHSFRPYDRPRPKARRRPSASGSESSWAPSQTTARTTPPPSVRAPYSTKDPDKIVVQAVYLFMNQFAKTPASQLVSGVGSVTDGLILRVTTEGLFIDDDVRGVPQREWDVKAWTLKQVEVWCPPHCLSAAAPAATPAAGGSPHVRIRARRDAARALTGDDADAFLADMLRACRACCALGLCASRFAHTDIDSPAEAGAWKAKGLHVVRATVRDQEGKRYVFVLDEAESWKVAVGLQRLRRGTQVRQLGVAAMAPSEARGTLETLGWG